MKTQHGYVVGDKKEYARGLRGQADFVDVTLEIRVRMSAAEAKEYDALMDDGRTLDATVTLRRTREGSPT